MIIGHLPHLLTPKTLQFQKGGWVFTQGDAVNRIYYVVRGRIKLVRNTEQGVPIIIHIAYAGEGLAEASLFSDQYHCSAQVDANTEVISFSKGELLDYLYQNPDAMMDLIKQLTHQVRDLRMLNEIKSIYHAKDRILACLSAQTPISGLSLKDIAQKIGMTHETLYRTLRILENENKITRQDGKLALVNQ